jgi:hypothetical protein
MAVPTLTTQRIVRLPEVTYNNAPDTLVITELGGDRLRLRIGDVVLLECSRADLLAALALLKP